MNQCDESRRVPKLRAKSTTQYQGGRVVASALRIDDGRMACKSGSLHAKGRSLWLLGSLDTQTPLVIEGPAGRAILEPSDGVHLIAVERNARVFIDSPQYRCSEVCVATLAKLIAFIDFGMRAQTAAAKPHSGGSVPRVFVARGFTMAREDVIQREFIGRVLADTRLDEPLFNFLRTSEAYWVVSFLLQQFAANKRVGDLGAQYGLSNAHFRRLCKIALGGSLKAELKRWRAASAVLRIVENGRSLTDIALEEGFASSSHLSREIKSLLGIPPSHIWDFGVRKICVRARLVEAAGDGSNHPLRASPEGLDLFGTGGLVLAGRGS